MEWFTDGSSFVEMGTRKAGYAIVSLDEVIETKTLTAWTSVHKAELTAFTAVL